MEYSKRYANQTTVSEEKSKEELQKTLKRYGADQFAFGWKTDRAVIEFRMRDRRIRYYLPLPTKDDPEISHSHNGKHERTERQVEAILTQASRQRWRALNLALKGRLETIESSIETFEEAFLAHFVMNNNEVYGDYAIPSVNKALASGKLPPLLPGLND